jgi:uncharacterized protein involved in outer membrane biogenesis
MKRIALIVLAVLVVLGIAAAVLLPRLLDPEHYRPKLEQMLAETTGRQVVIGPMKLHVFPVPGITADGFSLGEDPAFGAEPFLKANRIDARVRLMPLFSSRLDVISFDIEKPAAKLHRDKAGRWNLVSLIEKSTGAGTTGGDQGASGGGFAITIERFRLIDGSLDVTDESILPGKVHVIEGRSIQLTLSNLSTTSAIGIDLDLGLSGSGKGTLKGTIGPPPRGAGGWPIDAHVTITDFIGGAAAPYLATYTGLSLAGGSLDLDVALEGVAPENLGVQGSVVLKKLQLASFGGRAGNTPSVDGSVTIDATLAPTTTTIRKADVRFGGAAVTLSGSIDDLKGTPTADLRAMASKVAWKDVSPLLAFAGPIVPAGLSPDGQISLDVTARGRLDEPAKMALAGSAAISGFAFTDPSLKQPVRDIAATLALKGDRAELTGLAASLGRSRVSGACTVSRFDPPVVDVDLRAPLLDVDEILTFLPAGGDASAPSASPSGGGTSSSMLDTITVRGTIAVDEVKAMNLKLTAAHARLDVSGGEAKLHDIAVKLYGGSLAGDVTASLVEAGPPYALSAKAQGVDFNALCADFSKDLAGVLYGTLETTLDVKGRGVDTAALRNNLTGSAALALRNGKLTSVGFLKQMAGALAAVGGGGIGKNETPFDSLTGTFDIRGGRAATQDLRLDSADLDLNGKGWVGLDQSMAMNVGVLLSQAVTAGMVAKTRQLANLTNNKGELAIDVTVGGTLQKPAIGVDPKMLRRAAEKSLEKKGKDALLRLLDKKRP